MGKQDMVEVEDDQIVIRVPLAALPSAVSLACDAAFGSMNHGIRLVDNRAFALELVRALKAESDSGETMLTRFLDRAVMTAVGNGADGVILDIRPAKRTA